MVEDKDRRTIGRISIRRVLAETIESDFVELSALIDKRIARASGITDLDRSRGLQRVSWTREITYSEPDRLKGKYSREKDKGETY